MSEFIAFLPPPGASVSKYDRTAPYFAQPDSIPSTFREAMSIREAVFVQEQHVPIEYEFDSDDHRSWHWVTYASVGNSGSSPSPARSNDPLAKRGSTATRLAVATMRLVPPPHSAYPTPGSQHRIDNSEDAPKVPIGHDQATHGSTSTENPHNEPYVKIGRLATLPEFRKLGIAKLLFDTALEWASGHADEILPPPSATSREQARVDGSANGFEGRWKGLVLLHAQKHLTKMYTRWGFKIDKGLGEWDEEGIAHVAMWKRIHLKDK